MVDRNINFAGVSFPGATMVGDLVAAEPEPSANQVPVSGRGTGTVKVTVDPRSEADGQIFRAFQILIDADADDQTERDGPARARRDYTPEELETLFFALSMAMIQLRKLPGGVEARDRFYARAERELKIRGRHDVIDKLDAEAKIQQVNDVLDELGVPRTNSDIRLDVGSRVRWLGADRDLRHPRRANHRRVQRVVPVEFKDLLPGEDKIAKQSATPGVWEVIRWDDSDAAKVVKRALGDDVDLHDGTTGDALVRLVAAELDRLESLGGKLVALTRTFRAPGPGTEEDRYWYFQCLNPACGNDAAVDVRRLAERGEFTSMPCPFCREPMDYRGNEAADRNGYDSRKL